MQLVVNQPCAPLRPFVQAITIIETQAEATRTLVPDTHLTLGIRYRGFACELDRSARPLPNVVISGLRRRARVMRTSAEGGVVVVTFREAGAAAFFAEPLHELFGTAVDLETLIATSTLERLRSQLAEARDPEARVAIVERFLLMRQRKATLDPVVASAVRALHEAHGTLRIDQLASDLGVSRDRLEKRFRRLVGTTPKHHASILRLRRAIELHRPGTRLTDLALEVGYFDQAHFTRDFRAFTGESPRRFFGSTDHC